MTTGFIASTIPAKTVRVSGTTLFDVAMLQTGDALNWVSLAKLNGINDPWITAQRDILIPPVLPSGPLTGILDFVDFSLASQSTIAVAPPANQTQVTPPSSGGSTPPPPPPPSAPSLDFSVSDNSQYLPLI